MITFREWIDSQHPPDTPFGDFIKDAQRDTNFPNISSLKELMSYLSGTCDEVLEAAQIAWKNYEKYRNEGRIIKQTGLSLKRRFERQLQDAKKKEMLVFPCKKTDDGQLKFFCPHCLTEHRHGTGGSKPFELFLRQAHCHDGPLRKTGYYIYYDL